MPADPEAIDEWFRYARRDLRAASVLLDAGDLDPVVAIAQLQQAVEKALKGFLLSEGWELVKTHDLGFLHAEAMEHGEDLAAYEDLCQIATKAYLEERYPGAGDSEISAKMASELLHRGEELVDRLDAQRA